MVMNIAIFNLVCQIGMSDIEYMVIFHVFQAALAMNYRLSIVIHSVCNINMVKFDKCVTWVGH